MPELLYKVFGSEFPPPNTASSSSRYSAAVFLKGSLGQPSRYSLVPRE
jgi:hypothetical protein